MRKPTFCICENKDADKLRGDREADQCLCFSYANSTIPLLPKFQASHNLLWLYSPVCVGPGRKPRRPVFSQRGSYIHVHVLNILIVYQVSGERLQDLWSIMQTSPCNEYPLTSHFYIVTLGFTGVYLIFLLLL